MRPLNLHSTVIMTCDVAKDEGLFDMKPCFLLNLWLDVYRPSQGQMINRQCQPELDGLAKIGRVHFMSFKLKYRLKVYKWNAINELRWILFQERSKKKSKTLGLTRKMWLDFKGMQVKLSWPYLWHNVNYHKNWFKTYSILYV